MRVIAGIAKGRRLVAPKSAAVRPTTDRVKEAIFSMLEAQAFRRAERDESTTPFPFPRVLDLFAGSGALGVEALSRGAAHVDFVEASSQARAVITENLRRTGFTAQGTVHGMRAETAISTLRGPYDLILLDPPYGDEAAAHVLQQLGSSDILADQAIVIFEHARSRQIPSQAGALQLARSRNHGSTAISLFFRPAESGGSDRDESHKLP
jgi:16S rRNA (guanine(966)-N(2))-methyltransferase RsmD